MSYQNKQKIIEIINQSRQALAVDDLAIVNYQRLKQNVIAEELATEITVLSNLLMETDFVNAFRKRCYERAKINANSCLSFFCSPSSSTNQLYLKLAILLFNPSNLHQLMMILLPEIETCISPEMQVNRTRKLNSTTVGITFEELPITSLAQAIDIDEFQHYVCYGKYLFDVRNIERFNANLHITHHREITTRYPNLAQHLYQHNSTLRTLERHIQMLHGTPFMVIKSFIHELRLGGEKMTSKSEASNSAKVAVTDFLAYIEQLPSDTKKTLLKLSAEKSIDEVIQFLHAGNCVEEAACYLEQIINRPANQKFLFTYPKLTQVQIKDINKIYHPNHPFLTKNDGNTFHFPLRYLRAVMSKIVLHTVHDFLYLLIIFPPTLYEEFFQQMMIQFDTLLLRQLALLVKQGFLNPEQRVAFNNALMTVQEKRGQLETLIDYSMDTNQVELIPQILEKLPQKRRVAILRSGCDKNQPFLCKIIDVSVLCKILLLCPDEDRLALLSDKDIFGNSVAFFWGSNAEALQKIIHLLPESHVASLLQESHGGGYTLLHVAAGFATGFDDVLRMYCNQMLSGTVKKKVAQGNTVLHLAVKYPANLWAILQLSLTEQERIAAIMEENDEGESVLHLAARYPESLQMLLKLFSSQEQLIAALLVKTKKGKTTFQYAEQHLKSLDVLSQAIPNVMVTLLKDQQKKRDAPIEVINNYSFYITCFAIVTSSLGLVGLLLGLALLKPIIAIVGASVFLGGIALGCYGLFSHKQQKDLEALSPHETLDLHDAGEFSLAVTIK